MPDELFSAVCWSSLLFGVFMIKNTESNLKSFSTLKYDCVIKTIDMYNFLP